MSIIEVKDAKEKGLVHVSDNKPGFSRKRFGKGFAYYDEAGEKITDEATLERIKKLAIPPAWKKVWICKSPLGYLQATGVDTKNRKQYRYHEKWTTYQQESKFQKISEFGKVLPDIRKVIRKDLRKEGWPKEKVISLVLGILDEYYIRIGNPQYFHQNGTSGLTTLRRKNIIVNGNDIIFSYRAKSRKYRTLRIRNNLFRKLIRECSELPGYEVFRYISQGSKTVPVTSEDVNEYLKEITGENFTSKNFRTWGGTVLAIKKYPVARKKLDKNPRLKLRRAIVREVSGELKNTVTVCEKYYIHPAVLEVLDDPDFSPERFPVEDEPRGLSFEERLALVIIGGAEVGYARRT